MKTRIFVIICAILSSCTIKKHVVTDTSLKSEVDSAKQMVQLTDTMVTLPLPIVTPIPQDTIPQKSIHTHSIVHVDTTNYSPYAYVDFSRLIVQMPEYSKFLQEMDSLQNYLSNQYKSMQDEYQKKQLEFQKDTMALPLIQEMHKEELKSLYDRIVYFQSYSQQQLEEKSQFMVNELHQKLRLIIKEVSEELKLLYVFDNSYILSSFNGFDITPIVEIKMKQQ